VGLLNPSTQMGKSTHFCFRGYLRRGVGWRVPQTDDWIRPGDL